MFPSASYDSEADRFVPHTDYLDFEGFDFTDALLKMQVRDRPNGGALRADLAQVTTAAAEGVRLESVTWADGVPTTRIAWRINETTMEAMPLDPADPGSAVVLYRDLHITPVGENKFVAVQGTFTVKAGETE